MSDDDLKLTRRHFLRQSALSAAVTGGAMGLVLATDAQADEPLALLGEPGDNPMMYPYF
jgi:hypothetical protein